jgi:hypothetical protein
MTERPTGRPPYEAYAAIMGVFVGRVVIAGVAARALDRDPAVSQTLSPRFGRVLTWSLAAAEVNDWLQAGFAALTQKAKELEAR